MEIFLLLAGFVALFLSGNWLVISSVQIARRFKISTFVIGITIVAFGTSAPELLVSLKAVYRGSPDISIGNVVGSNIANIALVLGFVAIIFPIKVKNSGIWRDWGVMMLASFMLFFFSRNFKLDFFEGIVLISALVIYLSWIIIASRNNRKGEVISVPPTMNMWKAIGLFCIASIGLFFGAEWLVKGAREIALKLGVSERAVGISIVAFGTSVPELATSIIAALRKETDISIGNIIGSNIFNIWAILGITSTIKTININPEIYRIDYWWMIGVSALLMLLIIPLSKGEISRWKGIVLGAVYVSYIYLLFT
ncbi:calcium/sodium antiporter [Marinilabiliaceae bacterium JC017]|nr:calcium/sodium antiporter [Marinilabiliaceae bacterium JC017]